MVPSRYYATVDIRAVDIEAVDTEATDIKKGDKYAP